MLQSLIYNPIPTLRAILYMLPGLIAGFTLHEWGHAFAADRMGDTGPRFAGRLSLNPLRHIDWLGLSLFLLLGFGWAKPVETTPFMFRDRKKGRIFVSLAGVTCNLFLCVLFALLYVVAVKNGISILVQISFYGVMVNASLFALNLLPVPPLDGSKILMALFPGKLDTWLKIERYGIMILILLSVTGILSIYITFVSAFIQGGSLALWRFLL